MGQIIVFVNMIDWPDPTGSFPATVGNWFYPWKGPGVSLSMAVRHVFHHGGRPQTRWRASSCGGVFCVLGLRSAGSSGGAADGWGAAC